MWETDIGITDRPEFCSVAPARDMELAFVCFHLKAWILCMACMPLICLKFIKEREKNDI